MRAVTRLLAPPTARGRTADGEPGRYRHRRSAVERLYLTQAAEFVPPLERRDGQVDLLCQLIGTEPQEALFLLHWLQQAQAGPGDVCEFGVAEGATSALIANEIRAGTSTLWLYDSFAGLSRPDEKDLLLHDTLGLGSMGRYAGAKACRSAQVRQRLAAIGFPPARTRVVEGFIRADLPASALPSVIAFAYVDLDLYQPTRTVLDLVHPRCRSGSIVMVDDFGFFSAGPETAVKEFLTEHLDEYDIDVPQFGCFCALRRR